MIEIQSPVTSDGGPSDMRIVVLNTVLSNTGDAAIFQAIAHSLSNLVASVTDVTALDSDASVTRRLYPGWTINQQITRSSARNGWVRRVSSACRQTAAALLAKSRTARTAALNCPIWVAPGFLAALRALAQADIVVSSGGTYLVDHYRFTHRITEINLAHAMGKPVYLWTQSMGPFASARAHRDAARLSGVVKASFFRDGRSRASWMRSVGSTGLQEVVPDSVFSLYESTEPSMPSEARPPVALLSVRDWNIGLSGEDLDPTLYRVAMRGVAEGLLEHGWRCIALSTCQGVSSYAIDDSRTAEEIFRGMPVEIDRNFHSPDELRSIIRDADLVISTRMHFAILALISRTPVIAVAYETKTIDLFNSLGESRAVIEMARADADWVASLFESGEVRDVAAVLSDAYLTELRDLALRPAAVLGHLRQKVRAP